MFPVTEEAVPAPETEIESDDTWQDVIHARFPDLGTDAAIPSTSWPGCVSPRIGQSSTNRRDLAADSEWWI